MEESIKKRIQQIDVIPFISINPRAMEKTNRKGVETLFSEETRRKIYAAITLQGPTTVAQLSRLLDIAPSAIHKHVKILADAKALREVKLKTRGVERHYDINFPVLTSEDNLAVKRSLKGIAKEIVKLIDKALAQGDDILRKTTLAKRAFTTKDPNILHMFITQIYKLILEELERSERTIFGDNEWVMYGEIIHFPEKKETE